MISAHPWELPKVTSFAEQKSLSRCAQGILRVFGPLRRKGAETQCGFPVGSPRLAACEVEAWGVRGFVPPRTVSPQWAALLLSVLIFGAFKVAVRRQVRVWRLTQAGEGDCLRIFCRQRWRAGAPFSTPPRARQPGTVCEGRKLLPWSSPPDSPVLTRPPPAGLRSPLAPPNLGLGHWHHQNPGPTCSGGTARGGQRGSGGLYWVGQVDGGAAAWQCPGTTSQLRLVGPLGATPCCYKLRLLTTAWECGANPVTRSAGVGAR